ncbi:MAG: hypothetical protein COA44_02340 [Arcobacter sp.]|nr:MAG: hypothetical protein COA44_02340 [Arcobacter sp.]
MTKYNKEELDELFIKLKAKGENEGIFDKTPLLMRLEFSFTIFIFILGIYSVTHFNFLITAVLLGTAIMRSFMLTHDLLHGQVFRSRRLSLAISYIFNNFIVGLSSSLWAYNHNVNHHTFTNVAAKDIDLKAAGGVFYGDYNFPQWFHKYQQIIFWPIFALCFLNFYIISLIHIIKKRLWVELVFLLLHLCIPAYVIVNLGWGLGLGTMAIAYAIWGMWFGTIYSTNHFGMRTLSEEEYLKMSRFESQVVTSRNIMGGHLIHWIYGGLNTQIEHHLYPKISRFKLLKAAKLTKEFCEENEIVYYEVTTAAALKEIYTYLKDHRPNVLANSSADTMAPSR